jgi:hypothetical protein
MTVGGADAMHSKFQVRPAGTISKDTFSDLTGLRIRLNNEVQSERARGRARLVTPFAANTDQDVQLEVYEDHETLGAGDQPGVLSLGWKTLPAKLDYSGFSYMGSVSRDGFRFLKLQGITTSKSMEELSDFELRFRFKGTPQGRPNFSVTVFLEHNIQESYKSRIEFDTLTVTDQWADYSAKLSSGQGLDGFLSAATLNPGSVFRVVWHQSGPITEYREGDTLLIDDLEFIDSKNRLLIETSERIGRSEASR